MVGTVDAVLPPTRPLPASSCKKNAIWAFCHFSSWNSVSLPMLRGLRNKLTFDVLRCFAYHTIYSGESLGKQFVEVVNDLLVN